MRRGHLSPHRKATGLAESTSQFLSPSLAPVTEKSKTSALRGGHDVKEWGSTEMFALS